MPAWPSASGLRKAETHPGIEYLAAFVSDSPTAKIDLENGQASPLIFRMRDRLSFMRTNELREARLGKAEIEDKLRHNAWEMTQLADHTKTAGRARAAEAARMDGPRLSQDRHRRLRLPGAQDLRRQARASCGVLGVQLEVNFVGTGDDSEHAFHNTDRFMRRQGYELFRLDVRTYSTRALPARYVWPTPAETVTGRPWQGEAYYARDIDAGARRATSAPSWPRSSRPGRCPMRPPSCCSPSATSLSTVIDVDKALDLLALQAQSDRGTRLGYQAYMRTFEADAPSFYRPEGDISLAERLGAAWRAFKRPRP